MTSTPNPLFKYQSFFNNINTIYCTWEHLPCVVKLTKRLDNSNNFPLWCYWYWRESDTRPHTPESKARLRGKLSSASGNLGGNSPPPVPAHQATNHHLPYLQHQGGKRSRPSHHCPKLYRVIVFENMCNPFLGFRITLAQWCAEHRLFCLRNFLDEKRRGKVTKRLHFPLAIHCSGQFKFFFLFFLPHSLKHRVRVKSSINI